MPTTLPRKAVNGMLAVPTDSPYIDHPPRDLRWLGALLCLVTGLSTASVLVRWVVL